MNFDKLMRKKKKRNIIKGYKYIYYERISLVFSRQLLKPALWGFYDKVTRKQYHNQKLLFRIEERLFP